MKIKKEAGKIEINRCGACSLPEWDTENRDYKGQIFIGRCKYSQFGKIIKGTGVVYIDTCACTNFQQKEGSRL